MLTTDGKNEIAKAIDSIIDNIQYEQDGVVKSKKVSTVVQGEKINITITLDDTENGEFKNFKILSSDGVIISERNNIFTKTQGTLAVYFEFNIKEV
ncbi:hypothetical protein [Dethiothermospora halolimnae]|uniref:hypothetical protein n=1 Tax=Dethiothermospora halolimnae TaxID=3114390 RepID=UPI003CCC3966